jgi:hypothetical protein
MNGEERASFERQTRWVEDEDRLRT